MIEPRLTNIGSLSWTERHHIDQVLKSGQTPVIQFSHGSYTPSLLNGINVLCRELGHRLQVRFYGFYGGTFDASVLEQLKDAQNLAIDCLQRIEKQGAIAQVRCLKEFSFGVLFFKDGRFLSHVPKQELIKISISDSVRGNLDLAPLDEALGLREVYIRGQRKNIDVLASLPHLESARLARMPKSLSLAFLSRCRSLRHLELVLGGRTELDFEHSELEILEVDWVRGLTTLGPLRRFPRLRTLRLERLNRLERIDVRDVPLRKIVISDCKNLRHVEGLETLDGLVEFKVGRELQELTRNQWPASLRDRPC